MGLNVYGKLLREFFSHFFFLRRDFFFFFLSCHAHKSSRCAGDGVKVNFDCVEITFADLNMIYNDEICCDSLIQPSIEKPNQNSD
jgi:hypothetical protein